MKKQILNPDLSPMYFCISGVKTTENSNLPNKQDPIPVHAHKIVGLSGSKLYQVWRVRSLALFVGWS